MLGKHDDELETGSAPNVTKQLIFFHMIYSVTSFISNASEFDPFAAEYEHLSLV